MNRENITTQENLQDFDNKHVVIKFTNGRALSGVLRNTDDGLKLKLGVQVLSLDTTKIKKVTIMPDSYDKVMF
jgi:small nuclear ribonucleoprotein (snRNP)-like protein